MARPDRPDPPDWSARADAGASADLSGTVSLVTGAGRGIGRATAVALARAGSAVALLARSPDELEETAALIRDADRRAIVVPADVTAPAEVARAVATAIDRLGVIDLLVNNAGRCRAIGPTWEVNPDEWWADLETQLRGCLLCIQAVVPGMVARGRGRVVNVVSVAGTRPTPHISGYAVAKAGLLRLTDTMQAELEGTGVGVLALDPGFVRTRLARDGLESDDARRWRSDRRDVAASRWIPAEIAASLAVRIAAGEADALAGRVVRAEDGLDDVLRIAGAIRAEDGLTLRLTVPEPLRRTQGSDR